MYLQRIEVGSDKVMELLDVAEYLQMAGLKEVCSRMLIETIKVEIGL
jgi:BTB/POZ domain